MQEYRLVRAQTDAIGGISPARDGTPHVVSVQIISRHVFSKTPKDAIHPIENFGVEGNAHAGATDRHLYHIKRFGRQPNLRQVHLIHSEFFDEVSEKGREPRSSPFSPTRLAQVTSAKTSRRGTSIC